MRDREQLLSQAKEMSVELTSLRTHRWLHLEGRFSGYIDSIGRVRSTVTRSELDETCIFVHSKPCNLFAFDQEVEKVKGEHVF